MKLTETNALLTGASRGLGKHIALALAQEGVNLVLVARSADALSEVADRVKSHNVNAVSITADLSDKKQVKTLIERAELELGPLDLLINNAGLELIRTYDQYPTEKIDTIVQVNLISAMQLTRAVLPGMLQRGRGHIVNISSLAGKLGFPCQTPYSATKAGQVMFTHSLRAELIDKPVGVSVVCPGFVNEDGMYANISEKFGAAPNTMKPTSPDKVARAVIKVIKRDAAEAIVNPTPVRPTTVIREIFSGITPYIHKAAGLTRYSRKISEESMESEP